MAPQNVTYWHSFENAVAGFYRELGAKSVVQNVNLAGNQIDIYIEEETASGLRIRSIVECKYYKNQVGKDVVVHFAMIAKFIHDSGLIDKAIMVSYNGYTQAAFQAGKASNIELLSFQDLEAKLAGFPRWTPKTQFSMFGVEARARIERVVEEAEQRELPDKFPKSAFIVMPFSNEFHDIFIYGIRKSVIEIGFTCIRADTIEHNNAIYQEIIDHIQRCTIIIAEVSSHNPNVFYEIGWAHALKKPTVLLASEGTTLPFDIQHINTIMYKNIGELEEKLTKRLQAITKD